jgi:acyl dehydratase
MLGAAGLLGTLATGTGTAGLVMLLARRPRPWAAALAVTGLYGGAGAVLAQAGIERLRAVGPPIPEETIRSVKADMRWMRRVVGGRRRG